LGPSRKSGAAAGGGGVSDTMALGRPEESFAPLGMVTEEGYVSESLTGSASAFRLSIRLTLRLTLRLTFGLVPRCISLQGRVCRKEGPPPPYAGSHLRRPDDMLQQRPQPTRHAEEGVAGRTGNVNHCSLSP
jgi:hypothetical protein